MSEIITAGILVIGDEILSGRTKDKNIGFIAEYLTNIGIDLKEVRVVADDEADIIAALDALRKRYAYVFTTGGIGYAFIIAMTATSFDRTAHLFGPRAWRALHLTGGYYLLFQFTVSFGKRIPDMPLYALFLIPLVAVFVLRMVSMAVKAAPRPARAG